MTIKLNDKPFQVAEGTALDKFVESLDVQIQGIAIAVNYEIIPKSLWQETTLSDGMEIMMVHAVSGG